MPKSNAEEMRSIKLCKGSEEGESVNGSLARKSSQKWQLFQKKREGIPWPLGYRAYINFLSITEAWTLGINNKQDGGRRYQGERRAPSMRLALPTLCRLAWEVISRMDSLPVFLARFSQPNPTWLLSLLSPSFILGLKKHPNCNSSLHYCTKNIADR